MLNHPNYKVNLLMENEGPGTIKNPPFFMKERVFQMLRLHVRNTVALLLST